nr:hypothetical protein Iba_chr04bCG14730 [Ipomoea batatas]
MLELSSFDLHRLKSFKSHLKQSSVSEEDDMGPWLSHGLIQIKILGINEKEDISIHWRFSCSQPDGIITVYTLAGFWYPYRILSLPMEASGLRDINISSVFILGKINDEIGEMKDEKSDHPENLTPHEATSFFVGK